MMLEVTHVIYLPIRVGIHNDKCNNKRVPKLMVIAKTVGKGRTNTRRVNVLYPLISPIDFPEMLMVVEAMDMVTPHLGRKKTDSS